MNRLALAALAASTLLLGCDPQPNVYKVAIDTSPLNSLPAECYASGSTPPTTVTTTNVVDEQTWTWWPGVDKTSYLQVGSLSGYNLASAADIAIGDTIQGEDKTFTATRIVASTTGTADTNTQTVKITLKDAPGATIQGTMFLRSEHTCSPSQCSRRTCEVTMNFVGRRLSVQQSATYLQQ